MSASLYLTVDFIFLSSWDSHNSILFAWYSDQMIVFSCTFVIFHIPYEWGKLKKKLFKYFSFSISFWCFSVTNLRSRARFIDEWSINVRRTRAVCKIRLLIVEAKGFKISYKSSSASCLFASLSAVSLQDVGDPGSTQLSYFCIAY